MPEEILTRIITRALSDPAFRDGLDTSPQKTLTNAGFVVTTEQLNTIVLSRPGEWGGLTLEDIAGRIDLYQKKR